VCDDFSTSIALPGADAEAAGFHATLHKLAQRRKEMRGETPDYSGSSSGDQNCNDASYAGYVDYMKNLKPDDGDAAAERSWTWQTCNEMGFYQSTDRGYNIFESSIPVK